jgi:SWI/SNF-related matrix-associated actin-dependent regulator 1 of chromatin subfamily A
MKLKPFQEIGRDFLAARKTALLADEMRLGKTPQVIAAADKVRARKILVICPATVKIHWKRSFEEWGQMKRTCQIVSGTKAKISLTADVIIINFDLVWRPEIKKQLIAMKFGVGAVDECHYLAGRNSKRTVSMLSTKDRTPILSTCTYKWFTSGTPITSRPRELYPILASCAPDVIRPYMSYTAYTRRFCGGYWDGVQWVDKGATNTADLNVRLHKDFMLRRLRKDVLGELPVSYQLIPIEKKGRRLNSLVAQEFNWEKDAAKYQSMGGEEIATVRRELGLLKIPEAVKHIKYLLTMLDKLVVFAYHRDVMKKLHSEIANAVVVMGGMSPTAKQKSIDAFTNDLNCRVFLGQITAAGVGIDLASANNILFVESSWVPGDVDQAADRCSGFKQTKDVSAQFMVIEGSLEEHMLRTVIDKKKKIDSIVEQSSIFN